MASVDVSSEIDILAAPADIAAVMFDPEREPEWMSAVTKVELVERALAAGAISSAVGTGRKMLREALEHLEIVPGNKYRSALVELVHTLDGMIAPFGSAQAA